MPQFSNKRRGGTDALRLTGAARIGADFWRRRVPPPPSEPAQKLRQSCPKEALGMLPVVVITSPSDDRLLTNTGETLQRSMEVRENFWGESEAVRAIAQLDGHGVPMERVENSQVREASVSIPHQGVYSLMVSVEDSLGEITTDEIRVVSGDPAKRVRVERDQDNALEAWLEHGLLGTQLGPNKNRKKW
jgi:Icc protein